MPVTARQASYHLVSYDIADPRRLQKMGRLMTDYGARLQYSVFVCYLDRAALDDLKDRVGRLIDPGEDYVVYLPICNNCHARMDEQGLGGWPDHLQAVCTII